jgi:hypothetical protein
MPPEENNSQADAIARGDVVSESEAPAAEAPATEVVEEVEKVEEVEAAEPEGEEEGEEVEEEPKGHMIPKTRFDQAVQKERNEKAELAQRLKQYETRAQQQQEAENFEESQKKVKELLKQHSSLLADGELDKASDVMEEVLQLRDDMQNARMTKQADNARNSAKIEVQYDATVTQLEAEYPEINPESEDFDQDAVRRVQMMVTGIMQNEGKNPAEALREATDILLKPAKQATTLREKPSEEAVESGLRRTQQQIDKNLKASEQQPPATDEVGKDHDKTGGALDAEKVSHMTWEEFIQVPDEELAKMRGDFIQ